MENTIFIIRERLQRASHPVAVGTRSKFVILDPEQLENNPITFSLFREKLHASCMNCCA